MDSSAQWDPETVEDAIGVLGELTLWELTPQRWEQVGQTLEELAAAHAAGDAEEFRHILADLDLNGPVRTLRIGSLEVTGITDPVLDRRNTLVHTLTGEQPAKPADEDGPGARPPR